MIQSNSSPNTQTHEHTSWGDAQADRNLSYDFMPGSYLQQDIESDEEGQVSVQRIHYVHVWFNGGGMSTPCNEFINER